MRNTILLLSILFSAALWSQSKLIASCCTGTEGRCTGSAYCTACKNCSRCAHCSNGGSCGVCDGGRRYEAPSRKPRSRARTLSVSSSSAYRLEGESLSISVSSVNLRKGPGTSYPVVEKVLKGGTVIYHEISGDWVFVTVKSTGSQGFIHNSLLK